MDKRIEVKWTVADGRDVVVAVVVVDEEPVMDFGRWVAKKIRRPYIQVVTTLAGVEVSNVSDSGPAPIRGGRSTEAVSRLGNVGLTQANHDLVIAAIKQMQSHPVMVALRERDAASQRADEDYAKHCRKMRQAMEE